MTSAALESTFLSTLILAIPKLDKAKFISTYLHEQSAHVKYYASQGRALLSSWEHEDLPGVVLSESVEEPTKACLPSQLLVVDYGFGTPVLKPRVIMRTVEDTKPSVAKKNEATTTPGGSTTRRQVVAPNLDRQVKRKRTQLKSPAKVIEPKSLPRKVRKGLKPESTSGQEGEHATRLKERRDRKRSKRAIIKPTTDADTESETLSERNIAKKGETKKSNAKARIPAGLALMHGFSATNVGSGRLTVRPSLNVGVFNKGKASAKISKKPAKESRLQFGFTEKDFLDKTGKGPEHNKVKRKRVSLSSSGSDASTANSEEDVDTQERIKPRKEIRKSRKLQDSNTCPSRIANEKRPEHPSTKQADTINGHEINAPTTEARTNSIVWDIELEDASLPSQLAVSESGKRSAMLSTRHATWGAFPTQQPPQIEISATAHQSLREGPSDLELDDVTSESASRCGQPIDRRDIPLEEASSKYFAVPLAGAGLTISSSNDTLGRPATRTATCSKALSNDIIHDPTHITIHTPLSPLSALFPSVLSVYDAVEAGDYEKIDSDNDSTEHLPEVDPQDYEYSEGDHQLWPLEDIGPSEELFSAMTDKLGAIYTDDELSYGICKNNKNSVSFHQWHELEGSSHHHIYTEAMAYEEEEVPINGIWAGDEDGSLVYEADNGYYFHGYGDGYAFHANELDGDDCEEVFLRDHHFSAVSDAGEGGNSMCGDESVEGDSGDVSHSLSTSGDLELGTEEEEGSVDVTAGRFAQGRALLLGYSEQGGRPCLVKPSCRPEVSLVEVDVAKGLRNHWLPQRL
ncbi:hypothetical protein FPV67DRAFT_1471262 [Lyophyllum atratum]|nr:hypothetical protein FPV67DRAFT_1471262 [Lyophyllum atratum]